MSTVLVLGPLTGDDGPCDCPAHPHPDLVQAQRPTTSQLMDAVSILGAFPDGSYLAGDLRVSLPL